MCLPVALHSAALGLIFCLCCFGDAHVRPGQGRSESELTLMYGMTILRFVNGIIDPAQKACN